MRTVYIDESGLLSPIDGDHFLIVTALITNSARDIKI